jgi:RNA polymerase sporulation-specific sigma factor
MLNEETEAKMCKKNLTDEEILRNENARRAYEMLSERYAGRVIALARTFKSLAFDDLIEEGLIALFRAIETYDENKGAKFSTYAYACIKNRLSDANSKGRRVSESETEAVAETDFAAFEVKEELDSIIEHNLTKLEGDIFRLRQSGMSYTEIANLRGIAEKSVDNAYFRAKNKLKKIFQNIE